MESEFEKTLKQHRDSLVEELLQLGKYRETQLVEWDIERNESDYEFYFIAGWSAQQPKIDELQKRVDQQGLIIAKVMSIASELQKSWAMFEIGKKLEQALKGGEA